MTRAGEFRAVLRRGRRAITPSAVVHVLEREGGPTRFGFIVPKTVGGAVIRNLVKRRMRASCRELLPVLGDGNDVVIRALPGIAGREWSVLDSELTESIRRITG